MSQGYYLDERLVCAPNQVQFDTYVSETYSFAYLTFEMGQNNQIHNFKECH